jgi:two-component system sensor histidine kinase KdpD
LTTETAGAIEALTRHIARRFELPTIAICLPMASVELHRLTRLFQDILDMARIDAAAIRVDKRWVTAADVVDAASAHVRHALEGHALRVEADDNLEVEIDPRLVSVALSHVLENAAQYSPADREILVKATVEGDGLHVAVTDRGPGLDPGELEHLFERSIETSPT